MRSLRRTSLLIVSLAFASLAAGCDSIDLSGIFFDGNRPAVTPASFDVVQQDSDLALRFHGVTLKDANADPGSNAITMHFVGNADADLLADVQKRAPDWIMGTQANADSGTIVAKKDVEFATAPTADGFTLTLKARSTADATPSAAPTVPVQTDPLRSDVNETVSGAAVEGVQRGDLRGAFGVNDKSEPLAVSTL